ncbi:MAG: paraquat-inducible protein A [Ostreibacterium sp.]
MKRIQYLLYIVWLVVVVSFTLGITQPIATVEKFIFFENKFSLVGSIVKLANNYSGQNMMILVIIVIFTFIFPIAKFCTMFLQIKNHNTNWQNKLTRLIEAIGHFSMLDVFIIALMVLLLKLRILVNLSIHAGFYWFTLSIVLSVALSFGIKQLRKNNEKIINNQ